MISLGTIGAIYKDYDNGYSLIMLSQKYGKSVGYIFNLLVKRQGI